MIALVLLLATQFLRVGQMEQHGSELEPRKPAHTAAGSHAGLQRELAEEAEPSLSPTKVYPHVALMFLARGPLPLERMWEEFFQTAAEADAEEPHASSLGEPGARRQLRLAPVAKAVDGARYPGRDLAAAPQQLVGQRGRAGIAGDDEQHDLLGWLRIAWSKPQTRYGSQQLSVSSTRQERQRGQKGQGKQQPDGCLGCSQPQFLMGKSHQVSNIHDGNMTSQRGLLGASQFSMIRDSLSARRGPKARSAARRHRDPSSGSSRVSGNFGDGTPSAMSQLDPTGVVARQALFSVYVHTAPKFAFSARSIFAGYQIRDRVQVAWGQYTVAEAERRLLKAALQDPRNQRFVLLSESCAPLYPPHVIYLQLLSEARSRLNACLEPGKLADRWTPALHRPGYLTFYTWRKASQWKALNREHAQLVAGDDQLWRIFQQECYSYVPGKVLLPPYLAHLWRPELPDRNCISDEHYVATLLSLHGRDNETTCRDSLTYTDWKPGLWSPQVYRGRSVNRELIERLRTANGCQAAEAMRSASSMFHRKGGQRELAGQGPYKPLSADCFLFARKFSADSLPWLIALGRDCTQGTGIAKECVG
ncbi:hypothetical protein N2152v2_000920 [Parachlorella kessleri]